VFLGGMSGFQTDYGKITLVLFVVALVIAVLGDKQSLLTSTKLYITMALGGLAAIVGIYFLINFGNAAGGGGLGKMVSIGFGLYLVILAGIAVVGIGIAVKK
jgi:hypothetical protein